MSGSIRFVYFDLGNILVTFDPLLACQNVARCFHVSTEQARQTLYDSGLQDKFEHGQVTAAQFAVALREAFASAAPPASDQEIWDAASDMFSAIDGMEQIVLEVASRVPIGLLSNTCEAHWSWIRRREFPIASKAFGPLILSYEVGAMKPDPQIYQAAQQAAGTEPEHLLFLDDRPENVAAARAHGWNAEQCLGGVEARKVLAEYGLLGE